MEQRDGSPTGGLNIAVDLGNAMRQPAIQINTTPGRDLGSCQTYRVRVERTVVMEAEFWGTPEEVIETAKKEAFGNCEVTNEQVTVWIPGEGITEQEPQGQQSTYLNGPDDEDMWAAYKQDLDDSGVI